MKSVLSVFLVALAVVGLVLSTARAADITDVCLDTTATVRSAVLYLNLDGGVGIEWCGSAQLQASGGMCHAQCTSRVELAGARRTTALNALDAGLTDYKSQAGF